MFQFGGRLGSSCPSGTSVRPPQRGKNTQLATHQDDRVPAMNHPVRKPVRPFWAIVLLSPNRRRISIV